MSKFAPCLYAIIQKEIPYLCVITLFEGAPESFTTFVAPQTRRLPDSILALLREDLQVLFLQFYYHCREE